MCIYLFISSVSVTSMCMFVLCRVCRSFIAVCSDLTDDSRHQIVLFRLTGFWKLTDLEFTAWDQQPLTSRRTNNTRVGLRHEHVFRFSRPLLFNRFCWTRKAGVPKSYSSCCCWNHFSEDPKIPKVFLIRSGPHRNSAYTYIRADMAIDLAFQIFQLFSNC